MAHSLTTTPPTNITKTTISSNPKRPVLQIPSLGFQESWACHQHCKQVLDDHKPIYRRDVALGLARVAWLSVDGRNASAASRRPPPPPKEEKKDPNVSGVQAKVLASKKRKEAMKQAVAKLREQGKVLNEPVKENSK